MSAEASPPRRRAAAHLLVAVAYLAVAAWPLHEALLAPRERLPQNAQLGTWASKVARLDQEMVVYTVARGARALLEEPSALLGPGQCYPFPRAYTLGEHMVGTSLLAALPQAVLGDPIASFNVVLLLSLWLAALAMYAFVLHATGSPAAAFVAGLLFALEPPRILDAGHPFGHADLWAPLALLALHRVFSGGRLRDAALLALALALQSLESLYPLVSSSVLLAAYGAALAAASPRRLLRRLPLLVLSLAPAAAVALPLLWPYLETRALWALRDPRGHIPLPASSLAPGGLSFPGWVALALAALGVADRLRGRARPGDPRLALLAGGALLLWCAIDSLPLPFGVSLPSLYPMARALLPPLGWVRVLSALGFGAGVPIALLAGFGTAALLARTSRPARIALAAALSLLIALERFEPRLATAVFGSPLALRASEARPPEAEIEAVRRHVLGPSIDLPFTPGDNELLRLFEADYLLLRSYRPGPIAACYHSLRSPLRPAVAEIAARLPDPRAAEALGALGFRSLVVHRDRMWKPHQRRFDRWERRPGAHDRLVPVARAGSLAIYRIRPRDRIVTDWRELAPAAPGGPPLRVSGPSAEIAFRVAHAGPGTFRHPEPIAPSAVQILWRTPRGRVALRSRARLVLPLAVAAGDVRTLRLSAAIPAVAGRYAVELRRAGSHRSIARAIVLVEPGA